MATSTKQTDQYNDKVSYVVKDMIWKDHVSKIETSQKYYDQRWGFLQELQVQNLTDEAKRSSKFSSPNMRSSLGNYIAHNDDMPVNPSPIPIPLTNSRLIGWRTADKNCTLEKYGKYARGQESLHKKFKWPVEGFD